MVPSPVRWRMRWIIWITAT